MFLLTFISVIMFDLLSGNKYVQVFYHWLYLYCNWKSNYQERKGWHPKNWFYSATFLHQTA